MTLTDSDLFELLVALKAGEVTETVRTSLGCLMDFVADADVFLHNWRPGKAAEVVPRDRLRPCRQTGFRLAARQAW